MAEKILEVKNLEISFKTREEIVKAIRGISFSLERGKTYAIVGESGSGKSVTVRAIMGISGSNEVIQGQIIYHISDDVAIDITKMKRKDIIRDICGKHIAMVFQDPMTVLDPTMTIEKQIEEGILQNKTISKKQATEKTLNLLEEVGIANPKECMKQYPHQLSGGMRQRVVIAIALSCEPEILICDEPTTALDVTIQAKIIDLIVDIQKKRGLSVVFITHNLGVVARVADDVAVMYAGRIVEQGNVYEIFHEARHPYTWGLLKSVPDVHSNTDELYSIPGNPPDILENIKGDAFAPRNPYALKIDYEKEPPKFQISNTHFVYSWLEDWRAPKLEYQQVV